MSTDTDIDLAAALAAIERKVDDRDSPRELAPELRQLMEAIPEDSPLRPRVLRLRGIVFNRLKDPKRALEHLYLARQAAIAQGNLAEIVQAGREITVVHAWRGEDRDAARALLRAVASDDELRAAVRAGVWRKPWGHGLQDGVLPVGRGMSQIGG